MYHLFRIYFRLYPNDNYFNPGEKRKKFKPLPDVVTIRFLSEVIGNLVAAFPAVTLGPFYCRASETDETKALQQSNGNYDASNDYLTKRRKNCASG